MTEQPTIRYTIRGAIACTAHTTAGNPCVAPAMKGQHVCQAHGGASPQARRSAKLRLLDLAEPAIAELGRVMESAERDSDKIAAINSILDRTGYGRSQQITTEDARAILFERLVSARNEIEDNPDTNV